MNKAEEQYIVVSNHEGQYSIWLEAKEIPTGWQAENVTGNLDECLDYIEAVWKDMRPRSIRN